MSGAGVAGLLLGTAILMISVEVFVHALVHVAVRFRVSAFLLAVVFSGIEFDNAMFGLATGFNEVQDVAFGLTLGNAISILGLTLALGALLVPFEVTVPRDYLVLMVCAPFVLLPVLLTGRITPADGAFLLGAFALMLGYVLVRERDASRRFMRSGKVGQAIAHPDGDRARSPSAFGRLRHRDWFWPVALVVALGGVILGAELSSASVERMLSTWHLDGTLLGLTVVAILYTIDDVLLLVEPLRLGYHDVAVGGVIGSLVFMVSANVGLIALVGPIDVTERTLALHFPVLVGFTTLAAIFLRTGRVTRKRAALLLGIYCVYLVGLFRLFGVVPIEG